MVGNPISFRVISQFQDECRLIESHAPKASELLHDHVSMVMRRKQYSGISKTRVSALAVQASVAARRYTGPKDKVVIFIYLFQLPSFLNFYTDSSLIISPHYQETYYTTHEFFLREKALYCVVWDLLVTIDLLLKGRLLHTPNSSWDSLRGFNEPRWLIFVSFRGLTNHGS